MEQQKYSIFKKKDMPVVKKTVVFYAAAIFCFFILLEIVSGAVIFSSHYIFRTPKRISVFWPHPLLTGNNIVHYETNWSQTYPVYGYRQRIHVSDECGYTTDKYGFIHNGDKAREIKKENFTVFIVGGSTVAGHGLSCNEQSISAQLEKQLRVNYRNIDVVNAGVPGYSSPSEFMKIANEILYYEPDMIISFNGYNDSRYGQKEYRGREHAYFVGSYHKEIYEAIEGAGTLWWSLKNTVWNIFKFSEYTYTRFVVQKGFSFLKGRLVHSSGDDLLSNVQRLVNVKKLPPEPIEYSDNFVSVIDSRIHYYLSYIRKTQALVEGMGVKYYHILQPSLFSQRGTLSDNANQARKIARYALWKMGEGDYVARSEYFWEQAEKSLAKSDINYSSFRDIFDDPQKAYSDYIHYTEQGSSVIAGKMYELLMEDKAIPGSYLRDSFRN